MQDFVQSTTSVHTAPSPRTKFSTFFSSFVSSIGSASGRTTGKVQSFLKNKKIGTFVFIAIVAVVVFTGVRLAFSRSVSSGEPPGTTSPDAQTVPVEREFSFAVYDKNKELSDPIRYTITTAQLTKQIIIKGQKANAISGRTFLILNLKLVNDSEKSLFLNTRNYVRVQPAGTEDKLAPEIHNDTVEVQPLSTKITRIGLPVDEVTREFTLHAGELEGEKEAIRVKF